MAGNAVICLMSSTEFRSILLKPAKPSFVEPYTQPAGCCVSLYLSQS